MPYKKARYTHKRYTNPRNIVKGTFRTVPLSHTRSKRKIKNAKAIVGKSKKTGKNIIQSVLIPKKNRKVK